MSSTVSRPLAFAVILLAAVEAGAGTTQTPPEQFDSLLQRASALQSQQQRRADLALPLLHEAIALAVAGGETRREAKAQVKLGAACMSTHHQGCALAALQRALGLARELGDAETENSALVSLGSLHAELGEYDEAVKTFELMLGLATSRGDAAMRVRALNGLAAIADRSGRGADGVRYAHMALQELDDGARNGVTFIPQLFFSVPYNLGKGLSEQGEYLEASRYFDRARTAAEKIRMISGVWHVLHETGEMDRLQGDLAGAERYYERALEEARKLESMDPEAMTLHAMGAVAEQRGDLSAALSLYQTALEMFEKAGFRVEVVDTLVSLSRVQFLMGQTSDATRSLERAGILLEPLSEPAVSVRLKLEAGNQKLRTGSAAAAASDYASALAIANAAGIRTLVSKALLGMAEAARARGDTDAALRLFAQGADTIDAVRANIPSADQRASFVNATHQMYEEWFETLLESARGANMGRREQAFLVLERERSRNLFDALHSNEVVRWREPSAATESAHRYAEQVSALQIEMAGPGVPLARRRLLLQRLDDAERKLDVVERPRADIRASRPQHLDVLSAHLAPDEVFVEYAVRSDRVVVFVITRRTFGMFERPVADLEQRILLFDALLSGPRSEDAIRPGLVLSRTLLADVMAVAGAGTHRIFICVAGALAGLPFAALPDPGDPSRPIMSRYEIAYASSLVALAEMRSRPGRRPPFDLFALAPLADGIGATNLPALRAELGPLPSSRREVEQITSLMHGQVETLIGAGATETEFKHRPLRDYKAIHLATHAFLDQEIPSRSAIVLARGTSGDDGWLQPREIASLDLAGQLVVLSACRTAGGATSSAEGMHSLARAFTYAGAKTVVGTLWNVEDVSSAAFVEEMYRGIAAGGSVAGALRRAQLRAAGDHPYRNARQWAGWIAAGDPASHPQFTARGAIRWYAIGSVAVLLAIGAFIARRRQRPR